MFVVKNCDRRDNHNITSTMQAQKEEKHESNVNSSSNHTSFQNSEMHSLMLDLVKTRIISQGSDLYKSVERSIHSIAEIISKTVSYEQSVNALTNSNILHHLSQSYHLESHPNDLTQPPISHSLSQEEDKKQRHHVLNNQHIQLMQELTEELERTKSMEKENDDLRRRVEEEEKKQLENISPAALAKVTKYYHDKMKEYEDKYTNWKDRDQNISWIINDHDHSIKEQEEKCDI